MGAPPGDHGEGSPQKQRSEESTEKRRDQQCREVDRPVAAEPRLGQPDDRREGNVGETRPVHGHAGRRIQTPLHRVAPALAVEPVGDLHETHEIVRPP